ncbi:MAG: LuxR C-terminal-related transcriptional regulator [Jatrophihabitans sp.]|uniref:LuxR C-terminal-related transcriptional regulator n=1 Tax=Jatrophihabitans sp. TaxID=1932789 RepID=UPI003F81D037
MTITTRGGVSALIDSCARAMDADELFRDASERLRELVPFDGSAWFGTDPATVLATLPARIENIEAGHCETYWERESLVEDALLYRDLARSETGVDTLFRATDDRPARSARFREFLSPQGYADELRAALRVGESTWGVMDLYRDAAREPFSAAETEIVRFVAPAIGNALRGFVTGPRRAGVTTDRPGTALFDRNSILVSLDDEAERLLVELAGPDWSMPNLPMTPVRAVLGRAVAVAEGRERGPAFTRIRSQAGRWLSLHASCLRTPDGRPGLTALTVEPAKSAQLAPIIVEAYSLTPREQEITRLVARGLSNNEIAGELFLSPFTVRDHLKAIFGKVGVASRGELVAKLFADHYMPELHTPGAAIHAEI